MTLQNLEYIWRWSDVVQRGIYIGLALMVAYTVFVLIRFLRCYRLARLESPELQPESSRDVLPKNRNLVSELSRGLGILKAIGSAAPLLGLAGTSYGILAEFYGLGRSASSAIVYLLGATSSTLVSPAAGIGVAIPAIVIHNALRNRVEKMQGELAAVIEAQTSISRPFRRAQTLALARRFSSPPPYALVAAPVFAMVVFVYMLFKPYELPKGLPVRAALDRCEPDLIDRPLVLRVTSEGMIFINTEEETWDKLAGRLAEIYRMRQDRTLYLQAEDDVPFQTVADAIDIARRATMSSDSSHLTVRVITPGTQAVNATCHTPLWTNPKLLSPQ